MNEYVFLLVMLNFGLIDLLMLTFFRRDTRPTAGWWVNALPFIVCPLFLAVAFATGLAPITPARWSRPLDLLAVALSAASIALMFFARGTHRIPLARFHEIEDAPRHIVTYGAYSRIRHPFYTSYLLLYTASCLLFPHWGTFGLLIYMLIGLNFTAAKEERRLSTSEFGAEYVRYIGRTGRFLPRLTGRPAEPPASEEADRPASRSARGIGAHS